jgi:hypothetical protein
MLLEQRIGDLTRVIYHRAGSAASFLEPEDVLPALDPLPKILHVTGITPALGPGPAKAVRAAVECGARVCLDVNYRSRLWGREQAAQVLRPLVPYLTVVVASDDELDLLAPASATTEEDRVAALLAAGVAEVVVKRGSDGASAYTASPAICRGCSTAWTSPAVSTGPPPPGPSPSPRPGTGKGFLRGESWHFSTPCRGPPCADLGSPGVTAQDPPPQIFGGAGGQLTPSPPSAPDPRAPPRWSRGRRR